MRPNDVANRSFGRSFRGYDADEVDRFLGQVGLELERLERRIRELETTDARGRGPDPDASDLLRRAEEAAASIVRVARTEREQLHASTQAFIDVLLNARTTLQQLIDHAERSVEALVAGPDEGPSGRADAPLRMVPTRSAEPARPRIARPTSPTVVVLQEERGENVR